MSREPFRHPLSPSGVLFTEPTLPQESSPVRAASDPPSLSPCSSSQLLVDSSPFQILCTLPRRNTCGCYVYADMSLADLCQTPQWPCVAGCLLSKPRNVLRRPRQTPRQLRSNKPLRRCPRLFPTSSRSLPRDSRFLSYTALVPILVLSLLFPASQLLVTSKLSSDVSPQSLRLGRLSPASQPLVTSRLPMHPRIRVLV